MTVLDVAKEIIQASVFACHVLILLQILLQ